MDEIWGVLMMVGLWFGLLALVGWWEARRLGVPWWRAVWDGTLDECE
jgi:hypothetical protein